MPRWNSFDAFLADMEKQNKDGARQTLVDELLDDRANWPWIDGNQATFVFNSLGERTSVALNMDNIRSDPPLAGMTNIRGTTLWYITRPFAEDDLLDYLLAIDDPLTPLAQETDIANRIARHWKVDLLNPLKMSTGQQDVSVLRMPKARPYLDWTALKGVPRGAVHPHTIDSAQLGFKGRQHWVYTPPDYDSTSDHYPLLILQDGQWTNGPLQVPAIADVLIKHGRMKPALIAMVQSGSHQERIQEYTNNDRHVAFLLQELLPLLQSTYRVDARQLGLGGVSNGAVAAAHAVLTNPTLFSSLILLSPPLGKGQDEGVLSQYVTRFERVASLPQRIFHSVGRYEARQRFLKPAEALREVLEKRAEVSYQFQLIGSGHGLLGFRSVLPEALAWAYTVESD